MNNFALPPKHVFVYGTLKQGYWNNNHLRDEVLAFPYTTRGRYYLQNNGYPYAVPVSCNTHGCLVNAYPIRGEVWTCNNEKTLSRLDYLEGYEEDRDNNHYQRKIIIVDDNNGNEYNCYIYERLEFNPQLPMCPVINGAYIWRSGNE